MLGTLKTTPQQMVRAMIKWAEHEQDEVAYSAKS
jgi:hypothetical protein